MDITTDCCTYLAQYIGGVSAVVCDTNACQDPHIVRAAVAPEQHLGKKSENMLHLLCHQGPLGTESLQQDSDHVFLWQGYNSQHDIAKHGYSGVVIDATGEWNGALLSSMMGVCSVCMRVKDVHLYGVDLVIIIIRSAFAHETQAPPQALWCGGHQLQIAVTFGVSEE